MRRKNLSFTKLLFVLALVSAVFAPTISAFAEEPSEKTNDIEIIASFDYGVLDDSLVQDGFTTSQRPLLRSNQTVGGGGSTYTLSTRKTISLKATNSAYQILMSAGLDKVTKGNTVASAIAGLFLDSLKNYKYMRQSIYKKTDKNYIYYKVIDEFSNSKTNFSKGPVKTYYSKVKR
ncbi:hypothetical protein X560_1075 [Listeria fleischmannii 1991]|uniref:Uncharacterized protein n=1 Tax=Listeria fleischmannii 1991 TaxID=1430899 RepID=A0A0J8GGN0_9LIST|nr:hypothetical protein [Listeria fleischmannii]EMG28776.1 hypothetical protein LFLEISCH_03480 [Listeria fleischmannii subsp. fleischmannii LU2006-1]KMT60149.1 hypothetical protein X560_1075 [Listeria fleischmannii 1991]